MLQDEYIAGEWKALRPLLSYVKQMCFADVSQTGSTAPLLSCEFEMTKIPREETVISFLYDMYYIIDIKRREADFKQIQLVAEYYKYNVWMQI